MPTSQKAPNAPAISRLSKLLAARGIKFKLTPKPGIDMAVTTPSGVRDVIVSIEPVTAPESVVVVDAKAINARRAEVAGAAFQKLTASLGLGAMSLEQTNGVDRGPAPTKKLHFGEHFDEVAMRHTEFRKSPNLPEEKVKQFMPIIDRLANSFYARNRNTLDMYGYGADDLITYGMVWLHNYFGVHRKNSHKHLDDVRLFTQYMKQRQVEFLDLIRKKARNVLPEDDALATGLYISKATSELLGAPKPSMTGEAARDESLVLDDTQFITDATVTTRVTHKMKKVAYNKFTHAMTVSTKRTATPFFEDPRVDSDPDEAYINAHTQLDLSSDLKRRKSATALLEAGLAEMDHETLILTLTNVVQGRAFCDDTRREADRRLQAHFASCSHPECLAQRGALVEMDDEMSGVDALSE